MKPGSHFVNGPFPATSSFISVTPCSSNAVGLADGSSSKLRDAFKASVPQPALSPLDAELDQFVLHDDAGVGANGRGQARGGGYGSSEDDTDVAEAVKADDTPQPHKTQVRASGVLWML